MGFHEELKKLEKEVKEKETESFSLKVITSQNRKGDDKIYQYKMNLPKKILDRISNDNNKEIHAEGEVDKDNPSKINISIWCG